MATDKTNPTVKSEWHREFGVRIAGLREHLKLTHTEFAEYLTTRMVDGSSVSASSVRRWERGEVEPKVAAWATMTNVARTRDLLFYLMGTSRRDQYAEIFANEDFLPQSGFLVFLELQTTSDKKSRVGAFAKVLNIIAGYKGRIVRITTWGKRRDKAQTQLLTVFELPLLQEKDGRPTDIGALRDSIASLEIIAYASMQVRTRNAIVFPVAGSPPKNGENDGVRD